MKRQAQTCTNIYSGMEKKIQNISYVAENDFKSTKMQYIDVNDVEMNLWYAIYNFVTYLKLNIE